jgi:ABC-type transport system substrate-binding protein
MFKKLFVILATSFVFVSCTKHSTDASNEINYGLRMNLKALDPALASDESANEVAPNIFESLYQYAYLKRPLTVEPLLADGMPQVSKDGLTVTLKIKKGVKFQDSEVFPGGKGRELVAQDFIYSWKRVADPKGKGEGFWIFDGKVKGINEWRDKLTKDASKFDDPIEGFQAPDNNTLVIKLTRPFYQLNYILAMTYTAVVPKEAVTKWGEEFMNHPVGTGPFTFDSWIRGSKITLVKNPTWHGETYPTEGEPGDKEKGLLADAGKPLPFIDKLTFYELPEDQPRWLNVMKGATDFQAVPKDNFSTAIDEKNQLRPDLVAKGMKLFIYPWSECIYVGFNMEDPILGKNVELRRALALAYDAKTLEKTFYNNQAVDAQSPIPPDMDGYDPNFKNPYKAYNLEQAREHLKKAGYPEGKGLPTLEYNVASDSTTRQMAEYLMQQFAQIGVKVNIVASAWPQFLERLNQKKAQMFGISWGADYPDAENMLQTLYSKNVSPGPNNANYHSKDFDAAYEAAQKLPPGPARTKLYQKMRDIFVQDMPWIPELHRLSPLVYHGWVNNLKRNETVTGMYKYLRVDTAKKAELKAKL